MLRLVLVSLLLSFFPVVLSANDEAKGAPDLEIYCLGLNMYHEARGESEKGLLAVALVTMNRTYDSNFPDTVCGVVFQKVKKKCQFSWVCKTPRPNVKNRAKFQEILNLAEKVYNNEYQDFTKGAKYFHNVLVRPAWAKSKTKTAQIGRHVFYR